MHRKKLLSAFLSFPKFEDFKTEHLPGLLNMSFDVFSPRSSISDEEWGKDDGDDDCDEENENELSNVKQEDNNGLSVESSAAAASFIHESAIKMIDELA